MLHAWRDEGLAGGLMGGFRMVLMDSFSVRQMDGIRSFVGEDASGSFGLLAGHARFMTCLDYGFCRFKAADDVWQYLAIPSAVLHFGDDVLTLKTRRYILDADYERMTSILDTELWEDEQRLRTMKRSVEQLERAVMKRIWEAGKPDFLAS